MGLARTGSTSGNGSGDIFIAFSTANPRAASASAPTQVEMAGNEALDPVFEAAVQATEEAIINAMLAADTMTGRDRHRVAALSHDRLRDVLKKYNRLQ